MLKQCLKSIEKAVKPCSIQIVIIINGVDKKTIDFLKNYSQITSHLNFKQIKQSSNGSARNYGLKKANGQFIYFLDDDTFIAENTLDVLWKKIKKNPSINILGGPNLTPHSDGFIQQSTGYIFESFFGTGPMSARYVSRKRGSYADEKSLILCNLAINMELFNKVKFDEDVLCNEENILLNRLTDFGQKMLYCPELIVYHHRRKSIFSFMRQIFFYGKGRMQHIKKLPKSFSLIFVIPLIFLIYLISLVFYNPLFYFIPLGSYALLDIIVSFKKAFTEKKLLSVPLLIVLFPCTHISYAIGLIYGIIKN